MRNITGVILIVAFLTAPAFVGAATQEEIIANIQQQIAALLQKVLKIQAKLLALIAQQTQGQIEGMETAEPGILEELEEQEEIEPTLPQLEGEEEEEENLSEEEMIKECYQEGNVWYESKCYNENDEEYKLKIKETACKNNRGFWYKNKCYDKTWYYIGCDGEVKKKWTKDQKIPDCPPRQGFNVEA